MILSETQILEPWGDDIEEEDLNSKDSSNEEEEDSNDEEDVDDEEDLNGEENLNGEEALDGVLEFDEEADTDDDEDPTDEEDINGEEDLTDEEEDLTDEDNLNEEDNSNDGRNSGNSGPEDETEGEDLRINDQAVEDEAGRISYPIISEVGKMELNAIEEDDLGEQDGSNADMLQVSGINNDGNDDYESNDVGGENDDEYLQQLADYAPSVVEDQDSGDMVES